MRQLFSYDSPIVVFLTRVADYMILSVLWLVFSLPIVTIGASTTAMYTIQLRLLQDRNDGIIKAFWKSFRANFVKSTILFLIMLPFLIAVALDVAVIAGFFVDASDSLRLFLGILGVFAMVILQYVFPLTAKFENTIGHTLKNSAVLGMCFFFPSLLALVVMTIPVSIQFISFVPDWIKNPELWMFLGIVALENVRIRILDDIFKKIIPQKDAEDGTT